MSAFETEYKKLNMYQKKAVEALEGPVMVVAGPGTGKTQVLALRIGNILKKTDIKPDGILCLTFTNSAVDAMKKRLVQYIGADGEKVNVCTFHSFGMQIIGEHYKVLGLSGATNLLEDTESALLFYEILNNFKWRYLRPRGNSMKYFSDLRSIISLLKRERITKEDFCIEIEKEIEFLKNDENSISTRGESKGKLKKEVEKDIQSLERSLEIVKFIEIYENLKKEKNVLDYDDVLESLVKIVEKSDDVASEIREKYLYILIDEHQDSSRVQNEFLKKVWGEIHSPDIFVVGDDRQLIYGFSGASIDHFEGFIKTFKDAKLIPLLDNYRSTQIILDASHELLQSVMSKEKLISQSKEKHPIYLLESDTEHNEILSAGLDIKDKIKEGLDPNECAILVPKNKQARRALMILYDLGLPVSSFETLNLFDQEEAIQFLRVLKIISGDDTVSFVNSFFDNISGIDPIEAHKFFIQENMREFDIHSINGRQGTLFGKDNQIEKWIHKIKNWKEYAKENDVKSTIVMLSKELFGNKKDNTGPVSTSEIIDTFLGILEKELEKNREVTLGEFVSFLEKIKLYAGDIPIVSKDKKGVKVLTMHSSKGLEFDYVWIAHTDEASLNLGKRIGFTLPNTIKEKIEERDIDAVKRKLYVAMTRARKFCTLSFSTEKEGGGDKELAKVIASLPKEVFEKKKPPKEIKNTKKESGNTNLKEIQNLTLSKYTARFVSASLLNNFFECPWKWYFRSLLQLPEDKNENLEFGIAVHDAIDKVLKLGHKPSHKEIGELVEDEEVRKIVSVWTEDRLPEIAKDRMNEQSVSMKDKRFEKLSIYGRIDLIEKLDNKNVRVTDFKTGSVKKKSEIEKLDDEGRPSNLLRQLSMYSYLLENSPRWDGVSVSESRLEFLEAKDKKSSIYNRAITKKDIELLIKDIQDYDNLVKTGEWMNRPCNYNSYGRDTECEYCKIINN